MHRPDVGVIEGVYVDGLIQRGVLGEYPSIFDSVTYTDAHSHHDIRAGSSLGLVPRACISPAATGLPPQSGATYRADSPHLTTGSQGAAYRRGVGRGRRTFEHGSLPAEIARAVRMSERVPLFRPGLRQGRLGQHG